MATAEEVAARVASSSPGGGRFLFLDRRLRTGRTCLRLDLGCRRRATSLVRSRIQRKPKTAAMTAPTATAGQLTTSPARMQAIPIAKPIGQRLGGGTCGFSVSCWLMRESPRDSQLLRFNLGPVRVSTTYQLPQALAAAILTDRAALVPR